MDVSENVRTADVSAGKGPMRLRRRPHRAIEHAPLRQDTRTVPSPVRSKKVLLVDDDHDVRRILALALRRLAFQVDEATTGEEALSLLEGGTTADLVITDMVMPGKVQGTELVESLAANRPGMPVILMSGHFDGVRPSANSTALQLPKPVSLQTMAETVKSALDDW